MSAGILPTGDRAGGAAKVEAEKTPPHDEALSAIGKDN